MLQGVGQSLRQIRGGSTTENYEKRDMVPGAGLEPARSYPRGILSPLCLPIPPPGPGYCAKMEAGLEAKMPANITGKELLTSNHSVNLSRKASRLQDSSAVWGQTSRPSLTTMNPDFFNARTA